MSKAFTRENDDADDDDELSAAPAIPAGTKNYMTPAGYRKLKEEYMHLLDVERPSVVQTVSWAAGNGDRSENGDYIYGKRRLREIDRRLRFLAKRMENSEVVDPVRRQGCEQVFFGATVTVRSRRGGAEPSGAGASASHLLPQSADSVGNVSEVRSRRGGAEPSGAGASASHLLPQSADSVGNVSEVRSRRGGAEPSGAGASASHLLPQSADSVGNASEVRSRRGGAEPSGAGASASHLLPQSADSVGNVSEVRHEDGTERTYCIVGIDEADAGKGLISWVSPLARALLKARADDVVKLQLPGGAEELVVVEVNYRGIEL